MTGGSQLSPTSEAMRTAQEAVSSWTAVRGVTPRIPLTGLSKQTPALVVLSGSGWRQVRGPHHTCLHDVHALEVAKQDLRPYLCLKVLLERG
jgi:hypothetical protein